MWGCGGVYSIYIYIHIYIYIVSEPSIRFYREVIWLLGIKRNCVGMKPSVDGVVEKPASTPPGPHGEVHPTAVP